MISKNDEGQVEPNTEAYPSDWAKVTLVVSPSGEMHAIDGDRQGEGDSPYVGLERIKKEFSALHAKLEEADADVQAMQDLRRMLGYDDVIAAVRDYLRRLDNWGV